jgi:hypothetical protein
MRVTLDSMATCLIILAGTVSLFYLTPQVHGRAETSLVSRIAVRGEGLWVTEAVRSLNVSKQSVLSGIEKARPGPHDD